MQYVANSLQREIWKNMDMGSVREQEAASGEQAGSYTGSAG